MLVYGIPTYTEFDHCRKAVETIIHTSTLVPDKILVIDNSETGAGVAALSDLITTYSCVHMRLRSENILSGAWNDIMNYNGALIDRPNADYVIIANDDVFPHPHSIEALVNAAKARPDIGMWNGSGHSGNSYSFFLLRQFAYKIVGPFDEAFKPAYFEDNDFDWRLKCAGLIREEVSEATFDHIGSATLNGMNDARKIMHHKSFVDNSRYYKRKWGEMPGKEKFTIPFASPVPLDLADA